MPLDRYVTLGRSGLRVSPFCMGCMTFGEDWGWGSSAKDSEAILDRFIDAGGGGGDFLDTANVYTKGHSEKIIGDHIGRHARRRHHLVIATKFFGNMSAGDPNAGGTAESQSTSLARSPCDGFRRTISIYIGCTLGTPRHRLTKQCVRLTIWSAPEKYATSGSPIHPHGRWPRPRSQLSFADGFLWLRYRLSIRCSNVRLRENSFRWHGRWVLA